MEFDRGVKKSLTKLLFFLFCFCFFLSLFYIFFFFFWSCMKYDGGVEYCVIGGYDGVICNEVGVK